MTTSKLIAGVLLGSYTAGFYNGFQLESNIWSRIYSGLVTAPHYMAAPITLPVMTACNLIFSKHRNDYILAHKKQNEDQEELSFHRSFSYYVTPHCPKIKRSQ